MQTYLFRSSVSGLLLLGSGIISIPTIKGQPTAGSITQLARFAVGFPAILDSAGNQYVTGVPLTPTPGAAQTKSGGGSCVFFTGGMPIFPPPMIPCPDVTIQKLDSMGNVVFGTQLGGPATDSGDAIAVDSTGNVYVAGETGGQFPTTPGAAIPTSTTSRTFLAKLSADGSRFLYSTYLPDGLASERALCVDAAGNAYIAATASSGRDLVILKLSADGSAIVYSRTLPGADSETNAAPTADAAGNVYVTGRVSSADFRATPGAVQTQLRGAANAFVTKLDPDGNIVFSTLLGGSGRDQGNAIQVDSNGSVYVAGSTTSLDFPTTAGTMQPQPLIPAWSTSPGGFVLRLAPDGGSLIYGSYIWSTGSIPRLAQGSAGDLYVAGGTRNGFPITRSAPDACPGDNGGNFLLHLDASGARQDATYINDDFAAAAIAVAPDGSTLVGASSVWRIRFGDPGSSAPACMTRNVFNSSTLSVTQLSPGEFVTLFGSGIGPDIGVSASIGPQPAPLSLAGVQVFFDGKPVPVLYAQSNQVNAQVPFEVAGQATTTVTLQYNGAGYFAATKPVDFAGPGLFRLEPNVSALAYAVNEEGTINGPSNPAPRGSIVALWGTGFGPTDPSCMTGGLNASNPVNLAAAIHVQLLTGTTADYAGSAPTFACGVTQINQRIPLDVAPGALLLNPIVEMTNADGTTSVANLGAAAVIYVN